MTDKLKPCPFCGDENVELYPPEKYYDIEGDIRHFVCCDVCQLEGPTEKKRDEAIKKWNQRADISKVETTQFRNTKYTIDEVFDRMKRIIREAWTP